MSWLYQRYHPGVTVSACISMNICPLLSHDIVLLTKWLHSGDGRPEAWDSPHPLAAWRDLKPQSAHQLTLISLVCFLDDSWPGGNVGWRGCTHHMSCWHRHLKLRHWPKPNRQWCHVAASVWVWVQWQFEISYPYPWCQIFLPGQWVNKWRVGMISCINRTLCQYSLSSSGTQVYEISL